MATNSNGTGYNRTHCPRCVVRRIAAGAALGAALASASAIAQPDLARQSMSAGNGEQAVAAWSNVLAGDPDNLDALIGRGTARGWRKDWTGAEQDLARALALAPQNLEALNAMAYVMAWSGRYDQAGRYFNRMLELAPGHAGARKGIAYADLWAGRAARAEAQFQSLANETPADPEPMTGVGKARLADGRARHAAAAYRDALNRNPGYAEARSGLREAYDYPALIELSVWGGTTSGGGDAGLRLVELGSWVTPRTRIVGRYDNGLSLDNPVLARSGLNATTWSLGVQQKLGSNVIAILEAGYRDLPAGENQKFYKVEGIYLSRLGASKFGMQLSPHSAGYTDRLIFVGHNFRLGRKLSFEPTAYFARTGVTRDNEWRAVGYGEYNNGHFAFGVGLGGGRVSSVNPLADGGVFTAFGNASVRVAGWHRLHLTVSREEGPLNKSTRVLVGVTLRLPRN